MQTVVAGDGDNIGSAIGKASLADDVDGMRQLNAAITAGNNIFTEWATSVGGSVVSAGGDEFRVTVPSVAVKDLPALRERYLKMVGASVSIGVGMKLSEADKALFAAKLLGKDRIVLYSDKVEEIISRAQENKKDEFDKIREEYLSKSERPTNQTLISAESPSFKPEDERGHAGLVQDLTDAGVRFEETHGQHDGVGHKAVVAYNMPLELAQRLGKKYGQESIVHSDGNPKLVYVNGENAGHFQPASGVHVSDKPVAGDFTAIPGEGFVRWSFNGEKTPLASGLAKAEPEAPQQPEQPQQEQSAEQTFHEAAKKAPQNELKQQVMEVLQNLKQQAPGLLQLKQAVPDAYAAVVQLAQAVMAMARKLDEGKSLTKAEVDSAVRESAWLLHKSELIQKVLTKSMTAAFRHIPTDEIIDTGDHHDLRVLEDRGIPLDHVEEGFVHKGKFLNRKQAYQVAIGKKMPAASRTLHSDMPELESQEYLHGEVPGQKLEKTIAPLLKPSVSAKQHRAMAAAASGNSTLGIPAKVGKEFIEADKGKKLAKAPSPLAKAGFLQPHHQILPVGTHWDPGAQGSRRANIKVDHMDPQTGEKQGTGWIQARSGMILSQDGHAISAKNPNGR